MKLRNKTLFITLLVVQLCSGWAWALVKNPPQKAILPNGMKVVVAEDHSLPVIAAGLMFKVGPGSLGYFETGLIPLTNYLREACDTKNCSSSLLHSQLEEGGCPVFESSDLIKANLGAQGPTDSFELILNYLKEKGFNLKVTQDQLEKAKKKLASDLEWNMKYPLGRGYLTERSSSLLFRDTPMAKPVMGTPDDLARLTLPMVDQFLAENMVPNNAVLVIVGDVDLSKTFKKSNEIFGTIPARPLPEVPAPVAPLASPSGDSRLEEKVFLDIKESVVSIGFEGISKTDPDAPIAELLETALLETNNSFLEEFRKRFPEVKKLRTGQGTLGDRGFFEVGFSSSEPDVDRLVSTLLEGLTTFWMHVPKAENLNQIILSKKTNLNQTNESRLGQAFELGYAELARDFSLHSGLSSAIDRITSEDLARVAKKIFSSQRYSVAIAYPLSCQVKTETNAKIQSLENGLKVAIRPYMGSEVVGVSFRLGAGYLNEPKGKPGMLQLLAKVLQELATSPDIGKAKGLSSQLDAIGAGLDAVEAFDCIILSGFASKEKLPELLQIMKKLIFSFEADQEILDKAVAKLLSRQNDIKISPFWVMRDSFFKIAYSGSPYERGVRVDESLKSMTVKDLKEYQSAWFIPGNSQCVIVGNFDPERVLETVKKEFGAIPAGTLPESSRLPPEFAEPLNSTQEIEVTTDCTKDTLFLGAGYRLPPLPRLVGEAAKKNDFIAAEVLCKVLTWSRNGILQKELVDKGLAIEISFQQLSSYYDVSFFFFGLHVPKDKFDEAKRVLKGILEKLPELPISPSQIQTAGRMLDSWFTLGMEKSADQAVWINQFLKMGMGLNFAEEFSKAYRAMTPEQVQDTAKRYFRNFVLITGRPQ